MTTRTFDVRTLTSSARRALSAAFLLATASLALGPTPAGGVELELNFVGTVSQIDSSLIGGGFNLGDPVTGSILYDTGTATDTSGGSAVGLYVDGIVDYELTLGSYTASFDPVSPTDQIAVLLDIPSTAFNFDGIRFEHGMTGADVNGFTLQDATFELRSNDITWLTTKDLPVDPATFAFPGLFVSKQELLFSTGGIDRLVKWDTTSWSASVVPEPGSATLLTLGLAGLAGFGRKRRGAATRPIHHGSA